MFDHHLGPPSEASKGHGAPPEDLSSHLAILLVFVDQNSLWCFMKTCSVFWAVGISTRQGRSWSDILFLTEQTSQQMDVESPIPWPSVRGWGQPQVSSLPGHAFSEGRWNLDTELSALTVLIHLCPRCGQEQSTKEHPTTTPRLLRGR